MTRVEVTHFTDPGCPWAYSAWPALATLQWRYGDQLAWRNVMIGLTEHGSQYEARGYTPLKSARGQARFHRYGMPFAAYVKDHVAGTSRGCRAIVAVRQRAPELEWHALRALQFMQFCSAGLLDVDADLRAALSGLPGIDADEIVAAIDSPAVVEAYEADRAEARTAEGGPTEAQGKTATSDGPVRFTAPSIIFEGNGTRLEAGGWQLVGAYDVLLANIDPTLDRRPPPENLLELFETFPFGLTTAEVALIRTQGNDDPDPVATEAALLESGAQRIVLGNSALWGSPEILESCGHDAAGRFRFGQA